MKNTGEILMGIMRSNKTDPYVNCLSELKAAEKESVKQALKALGQMLADLSYKKLQ